MFRPVVLRTQLNKATARQGHYHETAGKILQYLYMYHVRTLASPQATQARETLG